ncbi:hypothetical protein CY34DRAFT_153975 [Suillus luteus UH-Slu-Lm8-n1]|uniref:Uncharacterized protein n=1 Tax=Suillus luteus UH-Slu-Lm8-n1 TaxID=930992 RepID=A0A0D0AKE7_9AGAM|nr:hypothetical protein CY34DRAFT_153975 [Suillus luteus UH-Slu-Lm8-n1]
MQLHLMVVPRDSLHHPNSQRARTTSVSAEVLLHSLHLVHGMRPSRLRYSTRKARWR